METEIEEIRRERIGNFGCRPGIRIHEEKYMYWVYIVRCADGTLYSGSTPQLDRRMAEHNLGKGAKYTRGRRPVTLMQAWIVENRSQALQLEAFLKKFSKPEKERFILEPELLLTRAKEKGYSFAIEVHP